MGLEENHMTNAAAAQTPLVTNLELRLAYDPGAGRLWRTDATA
jgi:hypothetical protein